MRLIRRLRRLEREAREEAQTLRRRHGSAAILAAREKLRRPEVTSWGRRVIRRAIKMLNTEA
jgi:predicted RNA-binding protein